MISKVKVKPKWKTKAQNFLMVILTINLEESLFTLDLLIAVITILSLTIIMEIGLNSMMKT